MHITPTSDIPQPFKSAGFDACHQITDIKSERNNMKKRNASKRKGTVKKKFVITWTCVNPSGHKMWGRRVVWYPTNNMCGNIENNWVFYASIIVCIIR